MIRCYLHNNTNIVSHTTLLALATRRNIIRIHNNIVYYNDQLLFYSIESSISIYSDYYYNTNCNIDIIITI